MNTLIGPDDSAIAASSRFAVGSHLQADTLLVASVQLRRLWHIYSDMARALEHVGETSSEKAAKLVSLSMLTRTANRELEQAAKDWKEECVAGKLTEHRRRLSFCERLRNRILTIPLSFSRPSAHRFQNRCLGCGDQATSKSFHRTDGSTRPERTSKHDLQWFPTT